MTLGRAALIAVSAVLAGGALTGCGTGSDLPSRSSSVSDSGSGSGDPSASVPVAAGTVHVFMQSLSFTPGSVKAKVGQRVEWTNQDSSPHNVLYVSGPRFVSSSILAPGKRFAIRVTQAGTIHYYCSIHPWMKATVVVSG